MKLSGKTIMDYEEKTHQHDISEYDNVPVYTSNLIDAVILKQLNLSSNKYFCPFCSIDYTFDYLLRGHLEKTHENLLVENMFDNFVKCHVCTVFFNNADISSKHMIYFHDSEIELLLNMNRSADRIKCLFCTYSVNSKHHKLISIHMEKKHLREFYRFMEKHQKGSQGNCSNYPGSVEFDHIENEDKENAPHNFEFIELKKFIEDCQIKSALKRGPCVQKKPLKSILKRKGIVVNDVASSKPNSNPNCKKSLRFDIPTRDKLSTEKCPLSLKNSKSSIKTMSTIGKNLRDSKSKEKDQQEYAKWSDLLQETSTPTKCKNVRKHDWYILKKDCKISPISKIKPLQEVVKVRTSLYKCGRCWKSFSDNRKLLNHVNKFHKVFTLNILQPNYQCGNCNVKFFENEYLQKHCKLHHTSDSFSELSKVSQ